MVDIFKHTLFLGSLILGLNASAHSDSKTLFEDTKGTLAQKPCDIPTLTSRIKRALGDNNLESARHELSRATHCDGDDLGIRTLRATLAHAQNDVALALTIIDEVLKEDPSSQGARKRRARWLAEKGEFKKAREDMRLLLLQKHLPSDVLFAADINLKLNDTDAALELLANALQAQSIDVYRHKAIDIARHAKQYERAMSFLPAPKTKNALDARWLLLRGELLLALGKTNEAQVAFGDAEKTLLSLAPHVQKRKGVVALLQQIQSHYRSNQSVRPQAALSHEDNP